MQNKNTSLSLFLQVNEVDGPVKWNVGPETSYVLQDGLYRFEWAHDSKKRSQIRVNLTKNAGQQSYIRIMDVMLNGVKLDNLPQWSRYVTAEGKVIPDTYGYMAIPGTYILNVHANALSHNYMAYFLSCSGT